MAIQISCPFEKCMENATHQNTNFELTENLKNQVTFIVLHGSSALIGLLSSFPMMTSEILIILQIFGKLLLRS